MVCWAVPQSWRVLAVPGGEARGTTLTLALCQGGLPDVLAAMVAVVPTLTAVDGFRAGRSKLASWGGGGGGFGGRGRGTSDPAYHDVKRPCCARHVYGRPGAAWFLVVDKRGRAKRRAQRSSSGLFGDQ